MNTFILFRHGLATNSLQGYGNQIISAQLLPEAIPSIQRMAIFLKEIKTDSHFVSPIRRCQETVAIITSVTDKKFITDPRLTEFQGEIPGETILDLRDRSQSFLKDIKQNIDQTTLVCSHGAVIAALKYLILTNNFVEADQYDYPATGEIWIIHDQKVESFDFN